MWARNHPRGHAYCFLGVDPPLSWRSDLCRIENFVVCQPVLIGAMVWRGDAVTMAFVRMGLRAAVHLAVHNAIRVVPIALDIVAAYAAGCFV